MAQFNVNLAFNADTGRAKTQIMELQSLLNKIAFTSSASSTGGIQKDLHAASEAAKELQFHLNNAFNTSTGNFDLSMFDRSLKTSKSNVTDLSMKLLNAGATGQQAFVKLAQSISLADQPMFRISKRMQEFAVTMKNTIKWQLSSSMLHSFMGAVQSAYGYAQDLNKSLNDIRIVTGYNTDKMAEFAEQANKAAKALSTTTTDYTNASLIYFQQGLSDEEVTARTDITVKMANAVGQSAEVISEQLTAVWNNFDDGSKSLEYYADVMTALGAATASSSDEISEGLSKFAAVAGSVGLSYEYATSALATLTSNTRESADVVGNSLKTLFARIQGLQLGETLEDGTTLNKYSQALEKVGIGIYDASGGLKDMDNILDEMAAKWSTLSDTQQVALAQTVAGVRQYNQLIALMENWNNGDGDSMVANLNTVADSEGALQKQADIYAESWKAAEKRVQAAAEGIFQSLLDDKFFISLNNGFANLLEGIDAFIDGAGGIKSVLIGLSSIIITTFANKIPQALDTFKYNLQVVTHGTKDAYKQIQSQMQEATKNAFTGFTDKDTGKVIQPIKQDSAMGFAIEQANELTAARSKLALVSNKMSDVERQMAQSQLAIIEKTQQETIALREKNEELKKTVSLTLNEIKTDLPNSDIGFARGQSVYSKMSQYQEGDHANIGLGADELATTNEASIELSQSIGTQLVSALEKAQVATEGLNSKVNGTIDVFKTAPTALSHFNEIEQRLQQLSQSTAQIDSNKFNELRMQTQEYVKILPEGIRGLEDVRKAINQLGRAKTVPELSQAFTNLTRTLRTVKIDVDNVGRAMKGSIDSGQVSTLTTAMTNLGTNTSETKTKMEELSQILNNFQPQHTIRLSEAFGSLTGMVSSSAMALSSLMSVFSALENPNLSAWEKIPAVLMGITFSLTGVVNAFKSAHNVSTFFNQSLMKAAGTVANYGGVVSAANTSMQNFFKLSRSNTVALNDDEKATIKAAMAALFKGKIDQDNVEIMLTKMLTSRGIAEAEAAEMAQTIITTQVKEAQHKVNLKLLASQMGLNLALLPYIAALAAIAAVIGFVVHNQKQQAEAARENAEAAREVAAASREQADSNQELVDSYLEILNTYNEVKAAFDSGKATSEQLADDQNSLADSAIEVAKALGIEGAALAKLSGDYSDLTDKIIEAQQAAIQDTINKEEKAKSQTGEEFITDLRDGKGRFTVEGGYFARMGSGMDNSDEKFFSNADYSQYEHLWESGGEVRIDVKDQDIGSLMAAYEEAQDLYNKALSSTMTAEEMNKSEVFQNLKNWLEKSKESYEAYKASEANIQKYQIQTKSFGSYGGVNSAYGISSVEEYDTYASAMIKDLANAQGIEEGTDAWNELTDAVHAYLGSLGGVSDFASQSQALDDIAEKTGMAKDQLLEYYNALDDEHKELFFKIAFNRTQTTEELNEELQLLQAIADGESLQVKIDIVSEGLSLLNGDATTEEIVAWAKKMKEAYGEAFNLEEFLSFSSDDQNAYLQRLQSDAESGLSANRDQQIAEYQEAIARAQEDMANQESAYTQAMDDRVANQSRLTQLQDYKNQYNQATSKGETFDFSSLGEAGITDITTLNNAITATEDLIGANNEAIGSYEKLENQVSGYQQEVENLEMEKQVEEAYGWRDALREQAEALDINYDEVKDYAAQLRENNKYLEDNIELSEEIALAEKKQAKGADDLIDNYKDYAKVLKKARIDNRVKDTEEYSKAIKSLRKDLSLLTGYEEEIFTDDFINSDDVQQALQDVANGVDGATERLKVLAVAQEIKIKAGIEVDQAALDALQAEITNLNNQDIEIGAIIDEAPALDTLANLLDQSGWTTAQIQDFFNNLGWQPEIGYEEVKVKDLSTHASGGYVEVVEGDPYEGYRVVSKPVSAFSGMDQEEIVRVPKIGSKSAGGGGYKKVDPIGNSSSKAPSGGGGGGGSSKKPEKKDSNDRTRYHTIQNQLEDLKSEYDEISEAADRAFGKGKLKLLDEQGKALDDLIDKQEEYVDALKKDVPVDKAVMDAYYDNLIGGPAMEFDENGNIANYDEIEASMHAKYNEMAGKYTEDSEEWQAFEKQYEQMEKYIEDYEKYYDDLRDAEAEYQDLINQRIDLQLQKVQYKVELELDVENDEMELLEYQLSLIEDDAFKSAEAITLLTKQAESLYDQIQVNKQGLNDTLGLSLSAAEIASVIAGDLSVLDGKTFTEDQISAIRDYRDNLLALNEQFNEVRQSIEEQVMATFDAWQEKLESGIGVLDHYNSVLESYKNIVDIVGGDTLGLSDQFMADLSQASVDNAIDKVNATRDAYETMISAQKEAEVALEEARARGDEASAHMWEENLSTLTEEAQAAHEEMLSAWEEALSGIADQFEITVERVIKSFNDSIYALGGLDGLQDDFSRQQENADRMLDDYQKIYELSRLSRDINKTIDDTDSLAGKQKLKKLLGEINKLQEDGVEMSQYDLEYLQKTYDLRLAEIELEEAQRAKNTVRLSKDNEGNWSYIYTQNTDAVDAAQQKYEDALYAMQDLSSNYIDEMSEQLIATSQEMAEALAAIRIQDFASIDDYYAEVERVQAQYQDQLSMQQDELQKAIDNNKILYDEDWTNYHNATGYKISDTENFATVFKDTLLGTLIGSEEDAANFTDIIGSAVSDLTTNLMAGAEVYYQNLEAAMNAAGTSTGDFAEDTATNIDAVVEKSKEGAAAVDQMAQEMEEAFNHITDTIVNWQETYGSAMQEIINSNLAVIESFNEMLKALSIDADSITVKYDIANAAGAKAEQFDTGGYTGDWGSDGRLAVVHEKELILNPGDTANFLSAIQITRTMLETIDLNARQASFGLGNLVPTTIKDDNKQTLEQEVHITAEFPNVSDHNEIEEAFNNLINTASQYANRK